MSDYLYADDGKLHTRYTELTRCTVGQIDRVVAEREGANKFSSEDLEWGTDRHEMWAEESKKSGVLPECFFRPDHEYKLEYIEREFATDLLPGVICHSRMDAVSKSAGVVVDYKTIIADHYQEGYDRAWRMYDKFSQLKFYAYQLGLHGIRIKRMVYFIEVWNRQRDMIFGYVVIERKVRMSDLAGQLPWVKSRVAMLAGALKSKAVAAR